MRSWPVTCSRRFDAEDKGRILCRIEGADNRRGSPRFLHL
jgi:hypothetical protein